MLAPTSGTIEVLGGDPAASPEQLAKVGYVAQDTPTYAGHDASASTCGSARALNPGWDDDLARARVERLGLPLDQRARKLSGGQRAQLALTLGIAKRPQLLILDEPVASLDPLARREFLQDLMEAVAEHELSVILSSHLVSDLERTCDYLVVLVGSRVRLAGDMDDIVGSHVRLSGPRDLGHPGELVSARHTDVQSTMVVRYDGPIADPAWTVGKLSLEDIVLAYMERPTAAEPRALEAVR